MKFAIRFLIELILRVWIGIALFITLIIFPFIIPFIIFDIFMQSITDWLYSDITFKHSVKNNYRIFIGCDK